MLQFAVTREDFFIGIRHLRFESVKFVLLSDETRERGQARLPERALHLEVGLLRQIPDSRGPRAGHCPRRGFFVPDQDTEQGGLATAVGTDDGEPRAFWHGKCDAAENIFRAEGFGERRGGNEGHGGSEQ